MTLKRRLGHGVVEAWSTPVYRCQRTNVDRLNDGLRATVSSIRSRFPGTHTVNEGAWQSAPDLLLQQTPEIRTLTQWFSDAVTTLHRVVTASLHDAHVPEFLLEAWAVMHEDGHFHHLHSHSDAVWSGVYYVAAAGDSGSGHLALVDPRPGARLNAEDPAATLHEIRPAPGLLVAFPSWVQHAVRPVRGGGMRMSIAFNAGIAKA